MRTLTRAVFAVWLALGCVTQLSAAHADNVVARWIQLGPGSSAPTNTFYGDQPTSTTPTILARAVISSGATTVGAGACPALIVDGSLTIPMSLRFAASQLTSTPGTAGFTNANSGGYPQYFVNSATTAPANLPDGTAMATTDWGECEAVVPAGHTTASIGGVNLKLPIAHPKRILVIADTGCRMSKANQQNCHDPAGFPFAFLANYEGQFAPDLIIQVGDYFYRDTGCIVPASGGVPAHEYVAGCSNPTNANYETWGDTFDSWNADFLYPGKTLLATAPWVMTRGNHESCGRGARGWFALLDGEPFDINKALCAGGIGATTVGATPVYTGDFRPSYIVPAGAVNLLVHDSSYANDSAVDANMAKNYDLDLTQLLPHVPANSSNFYVTHKPTYGLVSGAPTNGGDFTEQYTFSGNASTNSAFAGGMVPYKIAMFLSGHIHQFEYVNFGDYTHFAPQLIVGVGGDNLDPTANPNGTSPTYAYQSQSFTVHNSTTTPGSTTVSHAYSQAEFGFAVLDQTPTGYTANVYNIGATKAGRCVITLSPRDIACWD
jgi:hypothetical protein